MTRIKIIEGDDFQQTLKNKRIFKGVGIWDKKPCSMIFVPKPANFGIKFKVGTQIIEADWRCVNWKESGHTTSLIKNGVEIKTIEHLLSALWGIGVDNVLIILNNDRVPVIDASAESYIKLIEKTGLKKQKAKKKYIEFLTTMKFSEPGDDRWALFSPNKDWKIKSTTSFKNLIGSQTVALSVNKNEYVEKIGWARTFLRCELDQDGQVWDNVRQLIPIIPKNPKKSPLIVYTDKEFLTPLRSPDEPARHKILDFVGDIALLGYRIKADVTLFKPGHRFTRQIVKEIRSIL